MAGEHPARSKSLARGLLGFKPRVAFGDGRDAGPCGERVAEFEEAGADLLLLQFSPQLEEMERFSEQVIRPITQPAAQGALRASTIGGTGTRCNFHDEQGITNFTS